jgi:hypothetical protein
MIARALVPLLLSLSLALAAGCGKSVSGMPCDTSTPCPAHYACALAHDRTTRCMAECDFSTQTVCRDGDICLPLAGSSTGAACYLGGNVPIGGTCSSDLDCTRTALCVSSGGTTPQMLCFEGCNLDGSHPCNGGAACLSGVGFGFCSTH